jgi:hypothetical protein
MSPTRRRLAILLATALSLDLRHGSVRGPAGPGEYREGSRSGKAGREETKRLEEKLQEGYNEAEEANNLIY